jgi:hypothetical protein
MCVVIIGGNDRMVSNIEKSARSTGGKAKIFTKMPAEFKRQSRAARSAGFIHQQP